MTPQSIGAQIKRKRIKINMSQATLAFYSKVSQGKISKIENGTLEPSLIEGLAIAKLLKIRWRKVK